MNATRRVRLQKRTTVCTQRRRDQHNTRLCATIPMEGHVHRILRTESCESRNWPITLNQLQNFTCTVSFPQCHRSSSTARGATDRPACHTDTCAQEPYGWRRTESASAWVNPCRHQSAWGALSRQAAQGQRAAATTAAQASPGSTATAAPGDISCHQLREAAH